MGANTDALVKALALDAEARRLEAQGRRLAAHVIRCRADERRRTIAEITAAPSRTETP